MGSYCLAGALPSRRLWLRALIVLLSRDGQSDSTFPAYNYESFEQPKYHIASVVAQDNQAYVVHSIGQGGW